MSQVLYSFSEIFSLKDADIAYTSKSTDNKERYKACSTHQYAYLWDVGHAGLFYSSITVPVIITCVRKCSRDQRKAAATETRKFSVLPRHFAGRLENTLRPTDDTPPSVYNKLLKFIGIFIK